MSTNTVEETKKKMTYDHRGRYNEPSPEGEDVYRLKEIAKKHMAEVKKK